MNDPTSVSETSSTALNPGQAEAAKKKSKKTAIEQIPAGLLAQQDAGAIISGIRAWAEGLKPKKKASVFAKPVTRAVVAAAISSPSLGGPVLVGLALDRTLFDPVEAVKTLETAVNAGVEGSAGGIMEMSVLMGSITSGGPAGPGAEPRPIPGIPEKAIMAIIACHHHAGSPEGCLSRAVAERTGSVDRWFAGWVALAMTELRWISTAKASGRKHVAGIARGITDVVIQCGAVHSSTALPLVLAVSSLEVVNDQATALTIMAQRKRIAESPIGKGMRQRLTWLTPTVIQPSATPAPVARQSAASGDPDQRLVDDLRRDLATTQADLADRDRAIQKLRADSGELATRLKIVGEERDAVRATREACEAEIERVRADVQDAAKALSDEVARTQRLKSDLAALRSTIDDDLRRQERATRALMAQRLHDRASRIGEWLLSVESGKADFKGLREQWDEFVAALRNEANP